MNQLNRRMAPDIESVFVMASPAVQFPVSSGIKEMATFGGDIRDLVPEEVAGACRKRSPADERATELMDVLVLIDKLDDLVHNAKPSRLRIRCAWTRRRSTTSSTRCARRSPRRSSRRAGSSRSVRRCSPRPSARPSASSRRRATPGGPGLRAGGHQAGRARGGGHHRGRPRPRARDPLGAEDYADEILNTLEVNLSKFIGAVQRGRDRLQGKDEPAEVS
jgi:hypothetical protein